VSVLAILLKNYVRPRGLARLGCPCLLTGSGMAFPWPVISAAPLASGNIVEDMQLGLDLAMAGHPAVFCEDARITSLLPERDEAAARQRRRWEHGHINTLLNQVPRLLGSAARGRLMSLPLALELAVPPLSLLAAVLAGALAVSVLVAATTPVSWTATIMLLSGVVCLAACALLTWWRFGRDTVPFTALLTAPWYVLWKAPIYASFLRGREKQWQRTERAGAGPGLAGATAPPSATEVPAPPAPRPAPRDPKEEPADVAAGA
jgi:cellulose synthase/poly-beta-1,6-N-acetylglucosamine synthase-like glycosyltransferase